MITANGERFPIVLTHQQQNSMIQKNRLNIVIYLF